jgi:hypothetical protein
MAKGGWERVPVFGPRATEVIGAVLSREHDLVPCEHQPAEDRIWVSLRPGSLLCGSCHEAARAMARLEDFWCASCGGPAGADIGHTAILARPRADLAVYFFMCHDCSAQDAR